MHKAMLQITRKVLQECLPLQQYHRSILQIYGAESSDYPPYLTAYYLSHLVDTVSIVHSHHNQCTDQELRDKLIAAPLS